MKIFNIAFLCGMLGLFGVYSSALPAARCVCELSSDEEFSDTGFQDEGANVLESFKPAMVYAMDHGNLSAFKAILNNQLFLSKVNRDFALYLWEHSNSEFCVAILSCDRIVDLLGRQKLQAGFCVAAGGMGDVNVVKAMLSSSKVLPLLSRDCINKAFTLAAGFGHVDIVKFFIEPKRLFKFENIVDKTTANEALEYAAVGRHFGVVNLIINTGYLLTKFDLDTLCKAKSQCDAFLKVAAREAKPWWRPF